MKPFTLTKRGSRIEVTRSNGLIRFITMRGKKAILTEYIIPKDLKSFTEFLINTGYSKS